MSCMYPQPGLDCRIGLLAHSSSGAACFLIDRYAKALGLGSMSPDMSSGIEWGLNERNSRATDVEKGSSGDMLFQIAQHYEHEALQALQEGHYRDALEYYGEVEYCLKRIMGKDTAARIRVAEQQMK